ncbi:MAG: DUF554 domain-containing protein [Clostridiales bacterium]|nr:DUF554 domain-containing protein [Clostridiales bacterium]
MDSLGERIKKATKKEDDNRFVEGFVSVSLIFCVGINIAFGKKFRVGNMLPAILVPAIYNAVVSLVK